MGQKIFKIAPVKLSRSIAPKYPLSIWRATDRDGPNPNCLIFRNINQINIYQSTVRYRLLTMAIILLQFLQSFYLPHRQMPPYLCSSENRRESQARAHPLHEASKRSSESLTYAAQSLIFGTSSEFQRSAHDHLPYPEALLSHYVVNLSDTPLKLEVRQQSPVVKLTERPDGSRRLFESISWLWTPFPMTGNVTHGYVV